MIRKTEWRRWRAGTATATAIALTLVATSVPGTATASDTLPWVGLGEKGANHPYQHGYTSADLLRWTPTSGVPEEFYDPTLDWTQKWFEFGMLNLPNSGYTNAAHKNGVRSLGCVFFSGNDRGSQTYQEMLV